MADTTKPTQRKHYADATENIEYKNKCVRACVCVCVFHWLLLYDNVSCALLLYVNDLCHWIGKALSMSTYWPCYVCKGKSLAYCLLVVLVSFFDRGRNMRVAFFLGINTTMNFELDCLIVVCWHLSEGRRIITML